MAERPGCEQAFTVAGGCAMIRAMNATVLSASAIALYLVTSLMLAQRFARSADGARISSVPHLSLGMGAGLLHATLLADLIMTSGGLNLGFFNAVSLIALIITWFVLLSAWRMPVENLLIVVLPISAAAIVCTLLWPSDNLLAHDMPWQLHAHIIISIVAYSILSTAALQSLVLYVQDKRLHERKPGGLIRALPPLPTMEDLLFRMIATGFVLLSAALLTGFAYLEDMFAQHLVHKTILSGIAWLLFGVLLMGRHQWGWRGRTAIRWTLWGFVFLMLAYFGSKFALELILQRGA